MNELVRDWKAEKKDLEEAFDIIADKLVKAAAEIERLKALITELAEAVQYCHVYRINDTTISEHRELMQFAREVTR